MANVKKKKGKNSKKEINVPPKPDVCEEPCPFHKDKIIKYYCSNHDEVCCSVCATLNHRSCDQVVYIPEVAKGIKKSKEFADVTKNMKLFLNQFQKVQTENEQDIKKLQMYRDDFHKSVMSWRQQINNVLDKLTKNILSEMDRISSREKKRTQARADSFNDVIEKLQKGCEEMLDNKYEGDCQCFVSTKKYARQMKEFETIQKQSEEKASKIEKFEFEIDPKIRDMLQGIESIGRVRLLSRTNANSMGSTESLPTLRSYSKLSMTASSSTSVQPIIDNKKITNTSTFSPKMLEDDVSCNVTAMTLLEDLRMVLIDTANNAVKLTDEEWKCTSRFTMSNPPWDVQTISKDQLVVTVPDAKQLQFFLIGPALMPGDPVSTKSKCYGLGYCQEQLIVTCPKDVPPCVKLLTVEGKMVRQISLGSRCERLFKTPLFVTASKEEDMVYISDSKFHTITMVTSDLRSVVAVYRDANMKYPHGLTKDKDGNIYICGQWFHNIFQIGAENNKLIQILDHDDGLKKPQGVYIHAATDQLFVSMKDINLIKVYQIKDA